MKKIILLGAVLLSFMYSAQAGHVGINTAAPETTLDIRAKNHLGTVTPNDGLLVPRVSSLSVSGVINGQLVYLVADEGSFVKGFHYWNGTAWTPFISSSSGGDNTDDAFINDAPNAMVKLNTQSDGSIARSAGAEFVIKDNGNVGVGTVSPTQKLDIGTGNMRIRDINTHLGANTDKVVVADATGVLKTVTMPKSEIEIMRFGVNGVTAGTFYPNNQLSPLRFNKYNDDLELGTTPSGHYNFVNVIANSSFIENTVLSSFPVLAGENPVPASRTTDAISLPQGIYEITFRIRSSLATGIDASAKANILISVNNKYFTKTETYMGTAGSVNESSVILDVKNASDLIDFLFEPISSVGSSSTQIFDVATFGGVNDCMNPIQTMKSEIIIKKLTPQDTTIRGCRL